MAAWSGTLQPHAGLCVGATYWAVWPCGCQPCCLVAHRAPRLSPPASPACAGLGLRPLRRGGGGLRGFSFCCGGATGRCTRLHTAFLGPARSAGRAAGAPGTLWAHAHTSLARTQSCTFDFSARSAARVLPCRAGSCQQQSVPGPLPGLLPRHFDVTHPDCAPAFIHRVKQKIKKMFSSRRLSGCSPAALTAPNRLARATPWLAVPPHVLIPLTR